MNRPLSQGHPPRQGCSNHVGEEIQTFCRECNQLLCLQCLTVGHAGHKFITYEKYIATRRKQLEMQLRRVKDIIWKTENFKAISATHQVQYDKIYCDCRDAVKSFSITDDAMRKWKDGVIDKLEAKKKQQMEKLKDDESINNHLQVKVPTVSINKPGMDKLNEKVRELTPKFIAAICQPSPPFSSYCDRSMYSRSLSLSECRPESVMMTNEEVKHKPCESFVSIPPPLPGGHPTLKYDTCSSIPNNISSLSPQASTDNSDEIEIYEIPEEVSSTYCEQYKGLCPDTMSDSEHLYDFLYDDLILPSTTARIIPPSTVIVGGRFAEAVNEIVTFDDICTDAQGHMIISDEENFCLRLAEGIDVNSKKVTLRFKDNSRPKAVTYNHMHNTILVSTEKFSPRKSVCNLNVVKIKGDFRFSTSILCRNILPLAITSASCDHMKGTVCCYATVWPIVNECSIHCLDCSGKFRGKVECQDIGTKPFGLDYHYRNDYLIISDLKDGCLVKMKPDGHSLWDNKSTDARKKGVLKQPFGIAILPNECIAVTETGNHCVAIFSKEGRLLFRFGDKGSDQGQFLGPKGIAVRLSKELVVVDSGNHRIQIFSLDSLQLR